MHGDLVINISMLQSQSDAFKHEKILARSLSSNLKSVMNRSQPEKQAVYRKLIKQANDLADVFGGLSNATIDIANEVTYIINKIGTELDDHTIINTQKFGLND